MIDTDLPTTGWTTVMQATFYYVNDAQLAVLEAGPKGGKPMVLLHGIPANALLFRDVLPILADAGYRVLAPYMPGYGASKRAPDADYSLSAVADLYAQWIEQEGFGPVWLVGHDLGTAVSQMIAVRTPHLLTHLTLSNGPIGNSFPVFAVNVAKVFAQLRLFIPMAAVGLVPNFYMTGQVRKGFGDGAKLTNDMLKSVFWDRKALARDGADEFSKHLRHLRNRENVKIVQQLSSIKVPTLVLWSENDRHQPPDTSGKRLHATLPQGTAFVVVPDAGHFSPLEAPESYALALTTWIRSLVV